MPTPTHTRPTIRRPCAKQSLPLRRRGSLAPRRGAGQRGKPPLSRAASRSGGCAPSYEKPLGRGRAGGARAALPPGGWAQPTSQCRPKSPLPLQAEGYRARPAAVLLAGTCFPLSISGHFSPRPSAHVRRARPARYDLSPFFDRFNTPQRGRPTTDRSVPGRYDLSPFVDLSVAPQTQAGPRSSRHRPPEKTLSTIQSNSNRAPCFPCPERVLCTRRSLTTHRAAPRMAPPLRCPGSVGRVTRDEESRWPW